MSRQPNYKKAKECFIHTSNNIVYKEYKGPALKNANFETQFPHSNNRVGIIRENYEPTHNNNVYNPKIINSVAHPDKNDKINIRWETKKYVNTGDPVVWGPAFWFTVHNGAAKYPENASPLFVNKMKSYINGLPVMLPCTKCQIHATNHIEKVKAQGKLDKICSGRQELFNLFCRFSQLC